MHAHDTFMLPESAPHRIPTTFRTAPGRFCCAHDSLWLPQRRRSQGAYGAGARRVGKLKVTDVKPDDIDALHREVSETRPVRANRMVEVIRKAFNMAMRWGWRSDNPARGVHRNQEHKRARYLSASELTQLFKALSSHREEISANAIKLLLLTGARRGEVLGATWEMFDLNAGVWLKPSAHTKQRKEHRVPLSAPAMQLLSEMLLKAQTTARKGGVAVSQYVFPGHANTPTTDIKRTWLSVCRKAGLAVQREKLSKAGSVVRDSKGHPVLVWQPTARVHDLRYTYAAILASDGMSLPIIGALLGHTQPQTTARYAHLLDDPLRAATERVGSFVNANVGPTSNVIKIRDGSNA
jgi:integrase